MYDEINESKNKTIIIPDVLQVQFKLATDFE